MINPLRSEAEAYRFVWLTIGYLGAIVLASWAGGKWAGLAVFVVLTLAVVAVWLRARREDAVEPTRTASKSREGERRILVVANETVGGRALLDQIRRHSEGVAEEILVVVPALNSPVRHWASDEDGARAAAQQRLDASLARLAQDGIEARGEVGDGDPLQAIEDALRTFGADEIIISTHPEGRSNWLEQGLIEAARERFAVPITHVVVDLEAEEPEQVV
jgi:hypothetical protein